MCNTHIGSQHGHGDDNGMGHIQCGEEHGGTHAIAGFIAPSRVVQKKNSSGLHQHQLLLVSVAVLSVPQDAHDKGQLFILAQPNFGIFAVDMETHESYCGPVNYYRTDRQYFRDGIQGNQVC